MSGDGGAPREARPAAVPEGEDGRDVFAELFGITLAVAELATRHRYNQADASACITLIEARTRWSLAEIRRDPTRLDRMRAAGRDMARRLGFDWSP